MNGHRENGRFRTIIVGFDGSREAERALEMGLSIARNMDSRLEVLAVANPPEPARAGASQKMVDEAHGHYSQSLRRIAENAKALGIKVTTGIAVGHPAEQILKRAEQCGADLIVVGRRGRSTFEQLVMGSVSERVLRYAPCPVLVTGL
jgi:nucleotide-binding universal stress UspA family protein